MPFVKHLFQIAPFETYLFRRDKIFKVFSIANHKILPICGRARHQQTGGPVKYKK